MFETDGILVCKAYFRRLTSARRSSCCPKSNVGNIGHDTTWAGPLRASCCALGWRPGVIAALLAPFVLFMWVVLRRPEAMLLEDYAACEQKSISEYQSVKQQIRSEAELDRLLKKMQAQSSIA